jgi:3-hydroxybutyryl-CoA dehydratase
MSDVLQFDDLYLGYGLKPLTGKITQDSINTYAKAADDFNPMHVDPEFAKDTPFGGTIAHGMTSLAFVSRLLEDNFGNAWTNGGQMDVSFKSPLKPGDTVSAKGKVIGRKMDGEKKVVEVSVFCENQERDAVITGTATIVL